MRMHPTTNSINEALQAISTLNATVTTRLDGAYLHVTESADKDSAMTIAYRRLQARGIIPLWT